jgi:hypothetical protein
VVRRGLTAGILAVGSVGLYLALFVALERLVDVTTAWAVAGLVAAVAVTVLLTVARSARRIAAWASRIRPAPPALVLSATG